jgi:hypothetical protein
MRGRFVVWAVAGIAWLAGCGDEGGSTARPAVTLATLDGSTDVHLNRPFSIHATLSGGGPSCCALAWSPGAESTSDPNAVFRFAAAGPQTITVTATDAGGATATADLVVNVVNDAPRAIIVTPTSGVVFVGDTVDFLGYGLDPNVGPGPADGPLDTCQWTLDPADGGDRVGCQKPIVFLSPGTRTITMTVQDPQGLTGTAEVTVTVEDRPADLPPVASFTIGSTGTPPLYDWQSTFTFTGTASDAENDTPFTYRWTATALTEAGEVQGAALDLGTAATVTWRPFDDYAFFFGSGLCQAVNGQRVRVRLSVTDSAGLTGASVQEVRVLCPPA